MSEDYMAKPCKHCPFRNDVTPFLTPSRGEELAYATQNPCNSFLCHKTIDHDDEGEPVSVETSKECAGFLTLMAQGGEDVPDGFEPSWDIVYTDPYEMAEAYGA